MIESPVLSVELETATAEARLALVEVAARSALMDSGCTDPDLFVPHLTESLRAVFPGGGDKPVVVAVDAQGEPMTGKTGPAGAREAVARLRAAHPAWARFFR